MAPADRIDCGLEPGLTSAEKAEFADAKRRIAELETELAIARRAVAVVLSWCMVMAVPLRNAWRRSKASLRIGGCWSRLMSASTRRRRCRRYDG